jgi:hypothetical protein
MRQLPGPRHGIHFGLKGWAALFAGLAIFIAIASLLAIGFVIFVLPMIVLAPLIYYFIPKKTLYVMETSAPIEVTDNTKHGTIIDGQFRVIETNVNAEQSNTPKM